MKKKINLVIDCRMINMSGIGTYLKNIIPGLIESDCFDITCMGYSNIKEFNWFDKVKYIRLNSKILSIAEQFELTWKIPSCDLFWSPNWNIPLLFTKAKSRIVTIHDVYHLANAGEFSKLNIAVVKIYMKFIRTFYDNIITVSNFSKSEINQYAKISLEKISVIYLAVDDNYTKFVPDFETNDQYMLYVGNVKPHKNLLLSLKAFNEIEDKNLKFYIVGKRDGFITNDNSLNEIIETLKERVFFTGEISDSELKTYYKNAKLFLFPSKYEGFGLPILEAMKFNLPIISSSCASIPEVAGDGVIYFDAFNQHDLVIKINGFLSGQLICSNFDYQNQLDKFNWNDTVANHIKLFKQST